MGSNHSSDDQVSSSEVNLPVSVESASVHLEKTANSTLASSVRRSTRLALKSKPVKEVKEKLSPDELSRQAEVLIQRRMKKMSAFLNVPKTFKEVTGHSTDAQLVTVQGMSEVKDILDDAKYVNQNARTVSNMTDEEKRQQGVDKDVNAFTQRTSCRNTPSNQVAQGVLKVSVDAACKFTTSSKSKCTESKAMDDCQQGRTHERIDMVLGLDRVPKTNSRGRATRTRIIEAARRILIEQGTDKLSIDRVLEEAKVSKGSFIHHYPSRSALIEALVDSYAQHLDEVQRELEQKARLTSKVPSRLLRAYGDWYREFSEGRIDRGISPFAALAVASPENRHLMTPVRCWYREYFNRVKREPCGPTTALIVTLAYDALFFHHLLGTDVLTSQEKRQIVEGLERLSGNITHSSSAPDFDPDQNSELSGDDPFDL